MSVSMVTGSRSACLGLSVVAALCAFTLALAGCGSSATAEAAATSVAQSSTTQMTLEPTTVTSPTDTSSSEAGSGLFDSSIVHEIKVSFAQEDYDAMIETYKISEEKDWIEATVTIDGETYANAGIRLKGNSSIMGLRGDGRPGGPGANVTADEPEGLPWLIRLDKNVAGQNHEGIVDLVVRSNNTKTSLNEAVSLDLLRMAGLASQDAVAASFSVNDSAAVLRLVTELPDDLWMEETLDSGGALYKAEATGDYSYKGADPESYDNVFDQEAGEDNADLTPLIEFLDFINNSDDATFNAELADHLDIDSLATYLAMEELLGNYDDIDGPGNNSYLYYDPEAGLFTVVPWDHNLAFGGFGGGGEGGQGLGGQTVGGQLQDGATRAQPTRPQGAAPGGGAAGEGGPGGKSNILVERFHANPGFEELYQQKLTELTTTLYESGAAADVLAEWVTLLNTQASDLVDSSTVDTEAAAIAKYFTVE
jgi:spore coat protein CotH